MQNFYSRFLQSVEKWPQNVAVEMRRSSPAHAPVPVEQHTYSELRRMAEALGRWLIECEMPRGGRCAILGANSARWVAAYLGCMAAGGVAVPLDTAFSAEQVRKLLLDSGSGCLVVDQRHLPTARRAIEGLGILLVLLDGPDSSLPTLDAIFAAEGRGGFSPAELGPDDPAVILYTSGTTSDPKGVLLTHDNLLAEMEAVFTAIDIGPSDAIIGVLPLFHALAQMANLMIPFAAGARVIYLESLNTTELMRGLREGDATLFCCVPQFFYLIHERILEQVQKRGVLARMAFGSMLELSRAGRRVGLNLGKIFFRQAHAALGRRMRYLITGGSRFDAAVGRELDALGFRILQAYGLTETSGGVTLTPPHRNAIGSVGTPLFGVEVRIIDPEPQEEGPPAGEVAIRGRIVMRGYWNRSDATAEAIRDGWLHTGDLGYLDEDGNLFITGRRKEIIVLSSGKNIHPEEIEAHYLKSPWIKEICVIGLQSRPGEPLDERLHAVAVPNFELLRQRKVVNVNDVIRFDIDGLSAQLPSSKRILSYEIWKEELPRTTTRKLKRFEIQRRIEERGAKSQAADQPGPRRELSADDLGWIEQPDVARAISVIRRAAKRAVTEIHPQDNLELDLGLDSMQRVELLVELEQELGADVEDSAVSQVYTVRDLVDAVRAGAPAASAHEFAGWDAVLAAEPTDPDVLALETPHPIFTTLWFLTGRILNLLCRDLCQLRVTGLEKLPRSGPFLLCPNHQSFLDAPLLAALLPWNLFRRAFYLGTSEIWGWGWRRQLARLIRLIPVDPDSNLVAGMKAGAFGLRRGLVLVLYPEGERSIDGVPRTFKKGAAILSLHLQAPIYPVALDGFQVVWPRGKFPQRFAPLRVAIGDPLLPPRDVENGEEAYRAFTGELRRRVVDMWEAIRGEKLEAVEKVQAANVEEAISTQHSGISRR